MGLSYTPYSPQQHVALSDLFWANINDAGIVGRLYWEDCIAMAKIATEAGYEQRLQIKDKSGNFRTADALREEAERLLSEALLELDKARQVIPDAEVILWHDTDPWEPHTAARFGHPDNKVWSYRGSNYSEDDLLRRFIAGKTVYGLERKKD